MKASTRTGFNLIEAAIVLAIVGLVIGGIWVAAAQISFHNRMNNLHQGMLQVVQNMTAILQPGNYPTWSGGQNGGLVDMAVAAKAAPGDWQAVNGSFVTPDGTTIGMLTQCWGTFPSVTCPVINLLVVVDSKNFDAASCTWLARRFLSMAKNQNVVRRLQLGNPTVLYDPPVSSDVTCAATTNTMQIMFNPKP